MADMPNIVIVMADDLGFGDLGMYNYGATATPAIDSLARDGTSMTQHYSASPICAPARAAFLTGRYPQRSGVIDTFPHLELDRMALREKTMGDLMTEAGYVTGMVGKWHNGALGSRYHPNQRGYTEFVGFRGGGQDYWDWLLDRNGTPVPADGRYLTDVFTDEAVSFIKRHEDERFFLALNYTAPHGPFQAPADEIDAVSDREGFPDTVNTIAAMVRVMDRGIGKVLDQLEASGLADDTLVMFTSDNGPWQRLGSFEERTVRYNLGLSGGKEFVNEGGIRVPMMLRWPGVIPKGRVVHDVAHFTDWVPTLLGAIGQPGLERLAGDGVDLWPMLIGGRVEVPAVRCWQWSRYEPIGTINAAVRDGDWKLLYPAVDAVLHIREEDRKEERKLRASPADYSLPPWMSVPSYVAQLTPPKPQLFDVAADPGEQMDLSDQHPAAASRLEAKLADWYDEMERERSQVSE
jgi:arylsulfatase A-like enzyme